MADLIRVYQAPAHDLPMVADGSVQAIMLSSPYYGLRSYAGEQDIAWPTVEYAPMTGLHRLKVAGCDPACAHEWSSEAAGGLLHENRNFKRGTQEAVAGSGPLVAVREQRAGTGRYCVRCGGWKGPLGQEPTPAEFVAHIVLCAREWRRVLRPDGVLFFNIGDSYANDSKWGGATGGKHAQGLHGEAVGRGKRSTGLKAKDLIGIPWRVAFALQADGWTLRSSVAWTKKIPCRNQSRTDRRGLMRTSSSSARPSDTTGTLRPCARKIPRTHSGIIICVTPGPMPSMTTGRRRRGSRAT